MERSQREELSVRQEQALLAGVSTPDDPIDDFPEPLAELKGLATTAGARVQGNVVQRRERPDQATCLGRGKIRELSELADTGDTDVIIFDNELQPAQLRNVEKQTETKVVDRTELILDIFASRAHTPQSRLQVELAQLEYLRPRLRRMWTHLERHGGGIGTRGPGEQQLETDRRLLDKRIRDLKVQLDVVKRRKEREVAARRSEFRVCLVGYTNAGKSSLMRALTGADVLVADKLFATLDTRTRRWKIRGWGQVLLSDTVGFIRKIPHDLVESFKATLEEAVHADLLLHVVDASNPNARGQIEAVCGVLEEIGAVDKPTILVLNKIDRLGDPGELPVLQNLFPRTVPTSVQSGRGIDRLTEMVTELLSERFVEAEVAWYAGDGRLGAYFRAHAEILSEHYEDDRVVCTLRVARHLLERVSGDVEIRRLASALVESNGFASPHAAATPSDIPTADHEQSAPGESDGLSESVTRESA